MTVCSHTLVKNGMPFIGLVLRQALPFVDRALITISSKSSDGTMGEIKQLQLDFPSKVFVEIERVSNPGLLTEERQKMLDATTEDWVLFLDDDDYWPTESLQEMLTLLDKDVDAYGVNPIQLVDMDKHDHSWRGKYFTKFFKKQPGVHYRKPWPRDIIFKGDGWLYWKKNLRVPRAEPKFIHLSNLKNYSFRNEDWAAVFKQSAGTLVPVPDKFKEDIEKIYGYK